MRRLLRRAFTLVATTSLIVLFMTAIFWTSYTFFTPKEIEAEIDDISILHGTSPLSRTYDVMINKGGAVFTSAIMYDPTNTMVTKSGIHASGHIRDEPAWHLHALTSNWPTNNEYFYTDMFSGSEKEWIFPIWIIASMAAMPPMIWILFRNIRRRRKPPSGICQKCGYDLRANPNLCPECGSIPEKPLIPYNPPRSIT
jgi:hypothetical protein